MAVEAGERGLDARLCERLDQQAEAQPAVVGLVVRRILLLP